MPMLKHYESRLVRPFLGWNDCRELLSNATIRLRPADEPTKNESVTVRIEDASSLEPAVFPNIEKSSLVSALTSVGLSERDVKFTIFVNSPGLKKSIVAHTCLISAIPADAILLVSEEVKELVKSQGGIDLTLALTLERKLAPKPLCPFLFGAWIARKDFALRPEAVTNDFRISPLTDEKKKELKLPKGTTYWVELHGGSVNDPEVTVQEALGIWIDESVLDHLTRSSGATSMKAVTMTILADVISQIVTTVFSNPDEDLVPKSPLDSVLDDLSKSSGIKKTDLVKHARERPDLFRAHVQHMIKVSSYICSAT